MKKDEDGGKGRMGRMGGDGEEGGGLKVGE